MPHYDKTLTKEVDQMFTQQWKNIKFRRDRRVQDVHFRYGQECGFPKCCCEFYSYEFIPATGKKQAQYKKMQDRIFSACAVEFHFFPCPKCTEEIVTFLKITLGLRIEDEVVNMAYDLEL